VLLEPPSARSHGPDDSLRCPPTLSPPAAREVGGRSPGRVHLRPDATTEALVSEIKEEKEDHGRGGGGMGDMGGF
jgi:hypothetical protein